VTIGNDGSVLVAYPLTRVENGSRGREASSCTESIELLSNTPPAPE